MYCVCISKFMYKTLGRDPQQQAPCHMHTHTHRTHAHRHSRIGMSHRKKKKTAILDIMYLADIGLCKIMESLKNTR